MITTYIPSASYEQRVKLGRTLRRELREIQPQYKSGAVGEQQHVSNIGALAKNVSEECAEFLHRGCIRFGRAQKALNLYLKYLWCADRIKMPLHCPFDSIVISVLPRPFSAIAWTKLEDEAIYLGLVRAAKGIAKGEPLAEWELRIYATAQDKSKHAIHCKL